MAPARPKKDDPEKGKKSVENLVVRVEIHRLNEKPFSGRLSREDLAEVWSEGLMCSTSNLFGFASILIPNRALRVNYKLKEPIQLSDFRNRPDFVWEKSSAGKTDFFEGRILGYNLLEEAKIGDPVTVCVCRTGHELSDSQIKRWLDHYGQVQGEFQYQVDKRGFAIDDLEVEVVLRSHIPEFLPMFGKKIRIYYVGMKKQCNNCLQLGHLKKECENSKIDWFQFIESLMSGDFKPDLFGAWPEIIKNVRQRNEQKPKGNQGSQQNQRKGKRN